MWMQGKKRKKASPDLEIEISCSPQLLQRKMSMSYQVSEFWKEMPGFFFFFGIIMPVTVFLLLLIAYFWIKLSEVNEELAMAQDPRNALLNYHGQWQKPRRSGQNHNKRKN